ncbi:hypothetical protein [Algoriphagus sp.]|uniref:hypothetical protein n=1 Tax=Algoriphagus sp. TaxID=1872435 RepID=UPI003F71E683
MKEIDIINMLKSITEFKQELTDLFASYVIADNGISFVYGGFEDGLKINSNVNDLVFRFMGINSGEDYTDLKISKHEFEERAKKNGQYYNHLAGVFLSALFQLWEDNYREKIASEIGIEKNSLKSDLFGEVRLLRQAFTHNHFKPTSGLKKLNLLALLKFQIKLNSIRKRCMK